MKKLIGLGVFIAIIGAGVMGLIGLYGYANSLQKQAIAYEAELSKQYLDNQNELSSYISSFYEQVGIANLKSDKMDQILLDAVKGRYDGNTSAQVGQGQMFSAIKEAYPTLNLDQYDRIIEFVKKGREEYKGYQTTLLNKLQAYDTWRESGLVQSKLLAWAGVPTKALHANIGANVVTGEAAEKQMYVIVTTSSTQQAYQTGTQDPLQIPGGGVNRGPAPAAPATPAKQ